MKRLFFSSILVYLGISVWAVELIPTNQLLASYLERDSDLKSLAIDLEKANLSKESSEIDNGFSVKLSTGNWSFKRSDDEVNADSDEKTKYYSTFSPNVSVSFPQYSNLAVSFGTDVQMGDSKNSTALGSGSDEQSSATEDKTDYVKNTKISFSVDVLSSANAQIDYDLLKSERSILEVKRKITSKALEKEKSFYSEIDSLLKSINSIISKQQDLYDDKISFEKIKAQGYAKTSSTYRRAEMKVVSDEHEIETLERSFVNDYKIFYSKCGFTIELEDLSNYISLVPSDIPVMEAIDIHSFNPDSYTETESALWTNKINTMARELKLNYSLSANGGYTMNNSSQSQTSKTSGITQKYDTIDLGLKGSYSGVEGSVGVNIPVKSITASSDWQNYEINKYPSLTIGVSVDPTTFKKNKITEQTDSLSEQQEKMNVEAARANYKTAVQKKELTLEDILWSRSTNESNYSIYEGLEKDMLAWYKQGIITESEYLSAKVDRQQSSVTKIMNNIEMIIYNAEVKAMFVDDSNLVEME